MKRTPFKKRIGSALRVRRKEQKLSQERFGELVGRDRVSMSKIENGKINVRIDTLEKLCLALKVSPWEIVKAADEQGR